MLYVKFNSDRTPPNRRGYNSMSAVPPHAPATPFPPEASTVAPAGAEGCKGSPASRIASWNKGDRTPARAPIRDIRRPPREPIYNCRSPVVPH